ncbi:receptor-type tyrosine-protein phosphatase beta-like [Ptychodera flava]|uniref:receptor-type tyrosine-protein phosphatase beta-like n=1 Tax=Ptychodera flava TaxID=63121 RepID=UPI003969C98D
MPTGKYSAETTVSSTTEASEMTSNTASPSVATEPNDVDTVTVQRSDSDPKTSLDVTWTTATGDFYGFRVVCSSDVYGENDHEFYASDTTTSHTFDDLVPGRLYTVSVYTFSGVDSADDERVESNAVSENRRTKPNDVDAVTVERSDDDPSTSLDVSWTEATDDFNGYRVVYSSDVPGENDHEFIASDTVTSHTFDDLVPGRLYTVSVYTVSGVDGADDERVESNAVSENRRTKPKDVDAGTVERSDDNPSTSLGVSWTEATDDFNGYRVVCSSGVPGENDHEFIATDTVTSHTFDDLVPGRLYTVSVYTVSGVDSADDERVESNDVSENRRTKPDDVDSVTVERSYDDPSTSLDVSWTEATDDFNGYRVVCSSGVLGENDHEFIATDTIRSHTFDDLVPGRLYTVSVYTVSGVDSADDERVEKPNDVDALTVERSDDDPSTSLDVSWTEATDDFNGYRVVCSSGVLGENDHEFIATDTIRSHTFDDLVPGRLYTVSVYTVSGVDSADDERVESNTVSEKRRTKPNDVDSVTVERSYDDPSTSLDVFWTEATDDFNGYRVVCSSGVLGENDHEFIATDTIRSHTFDDLVPGRLYTVSVYTVSGVDSADDERVESNAVSEKRRTKPNDVDSVTVERSYDDPSTSLDVSWTEATDDFNGYRVVCSSGVLGENDHEFIATDTITSHTFDDLVPGRLYTVSVYTVSGVDSADDERVESNAVSEKRRTKPNDVDALTVERSDDDPSTSLDVSWTEATDDFTGYRVVCSSGVLEPNDVDSVTVERSYDDPSTSLDVSWTEATDDFNGYRVVCSSGVLGENDHEFIATDTITSHTFDDLVPGRLYTVSVYTVSGVDSADDERVESNAVSEKRRTKPNDVDSVTIERSYDDPSTSLDVFWTEATDDSMGTEWSDDDPSTSLDVSWTEATDDFTGYRVVCSSGVLGENDHEFIATDTIRSHTFDDLVPGRLYTVSVYTVSGVDSADDERVESNTVSEKRRTRPYYRRPLPRGNQVLLPESRRLYVKQMCEMAWIEGHHTGHSGKVNVPTSLYHQGFNEHLIKEQTGHRSNDGLRASNVCRSHYKSMCRIHLPFSSSVKSEEAVNDDPSTSLDVSWTEATDDFNGFRVVCSSGVLGENDHEFIATDTIRSHTFDDLVPGRLYTVSVYTVSGVDSADDERVESNAVSEKRRTKPNDVDSVTVERSYDDPSTSLDVSWTEATDDFNGYRVVCSSGVLGENDHEFIATDTITSHTFDDLVPGRLYTVSVYTVSGVDSADDERVESNAVSEKRRTKPNDVDALTVERSDDDPSTSLDVSWTEATDDFTGYRVVCSSGVLGENDHEFIATDTIRSHTFDDLVPGRLYTVSVYTVSGVDSADDERVESNTVSEKRRTIKMDLVNLTDLMALETS